MLVFIADNGLLVGGKIMKQYYGRTGKSFRNQSF